MTTDDGETSPDAHGTIVLARFRLATGLGFFGGALTFGGAWIWHFTGVASGADNTVGIVSLVFTVACMIAFRTGGPGKAGQGRRE